MSKRAIDTERTSKRLRVESDNPDPRLDEDCYGQEPVCNTETSENYGDYIEGFEPNRDIEPESNSRSDVDKDISEEAEIEESECDYLLIDDIYILIYFSLLAVPLIEEEYLSITNNIIQNFKTHNFERKVKVKFNIQNYNRDIESITKQLTQFYQRIMDPVINDREKFSPNDIYAVAIFSEILKPNKPFFISKYKIFE